MIRKVWSTAFALALLAGLVSAPLALAEPVAEVSVGAASIDWHPAALGNYERWVLTVSGPDGKVLRQEVAAGASPTFGLFDKEGNRRPDGSYHWELRAVPQIDPGVRKQLAAARAQGTSAAVEAELRRAGKLPQEQIQTGSFAIANGTLIGPGLTEERGPKPRTEKQMTHITGADQVIADDLIVQGSGCIGLDCVANESFGFDTIRLKENNTRIKFDDTSTGAGFPANDWQITANDSASGGSSKLSIEDITGSKVPFTITAGASTNSIFVDSTGRVGLRTSTPVLDLHIDTSNTPAIRLEQNNSGGFTAQTWDVAGNEANFFVRDVTGGSRLPFRIRPGAPTSSIDISASGLVGFGTASPSVKIDAQGSSAADAGISSTAFSDTDSPQFAFRRSRGSSGVPTAAASGDVLGSFAFRGYTGSSFPATNSSLIGAAAEEAWTSTANGSRIFFNTTPTGSTTPQTRMTIKGSGNVGIGTASPSDKLEVAGNVRVTGGSFIDDGTTLNAPDYVFEPGYSLMPIADLRSFIAREKHLPNVPSASDIKAKGLNLSQFQMHLLEKVEELTLYTLTQEQHLTDLRAENTELKARLSAIEKALAVQK